MKLNKYITLIVILVLLVAGVWLIGRPAQLAPESSTRLQALSPLTNNSRGQQTGTTVEIPELIIHEPVAGSAVDLSQLPLEPDTGDSLYDQWINGEIDLEEEELFLTPEKEAQLLEELADTGPNHNIQEPASALESIILETSFPGPDISDCCTSTSQGTVPPDPELAVGPSHLIAVVNIAFEIYNKQSQILQDSTTFSSLFGGISGCNNLVDLFDPNVLYDEAANRFFVAIASRAGFYCAAVSANGNPTGTWYRYKFSTTATGGFFDFPHAGIGRDAIYVGANYFFCQGCNYRDSHVFALNKAAMYANAPAGVVERAVPGGNNTDTPQPANLHGFAQGTWPASGPHYFITDTNFNGSTYTVYAWNAPFGANTFFATGTFNLTLATGVFPVLPFAEASQLGTGARLQTNDWRPQDNEYRNGFLWTTNTITCNPGGGAVTCVRWAQINPANGTIVQAGVIGSGGNYRYFSDLATNHCSDMAIGYTKSSSSTYAGIWVAGRQGTDPPNTIQGETLMQAGETPYTAFDGSPHRWGDYTGFTSDPNGRDFWYLGQYSKNTGHPLAKWGTHIGCYAVQSCTPTANANDSDETSPSPPLPEGFDQHSYLPVVLSTPMLPCGY